MKTAFLNIKQETIEEFKNIAEKLFNNYVIQTKDSLFRLTDIEFYWKSSTHTDESTYERRYVDPATGEWFFHYSGVDIALKNDETKGYGGILIREICDINTTPPKTYKGPQVCTMKLFSGNKAFSESFFPKIIEHEFKKEQIIETERIRLGENAKKGGFDKSRYRFFIVAK